jgi:peptide/nickel transport system permease protein
MIDALHNDYIRTARSKGLHERSILFKHGFRNAVLPVAALSIVDIPRLIGGALITEQVFGWPGMGRLMVEHTNRADLPVLMGILVVTVAFVALFSIIGDIFYVVLDPRIRLK